MRFAEYLIGGATTLCLLLTASAASAEPKEIRLTPLSKWRANWAPKSCLLARQFGTEKRPFLLSLRTYAPGYTFLLTLTGKQISPFLGRSDISVIYGKGEPIPVGSHQIGNAETYGRAMIFSTTMDDHPADEGNEDEARPYIDGDFEAQLDSITLTSRYRHLVIETGPMASAFKALRTCTDDLVKQLGIDPASQHGLTRYAKPTNQRIWARQIQAIYPAVLSYAGKGARVNVRVVVDKEGNPTRCDFVQTFTNTDFYVRACDIIMRDAKFAPALDRNGAPVPSVYATAIVYRMS